MSFASVFLQVSFWCDPPCLKSFCSAVSSLGEIHLLSEKLLSPTPDRAMPHMKRKRQKREKEGEKAAHVPLTAISR